MSMPTKGATQVLIAAGERLQEDGIALEDLGIRHPSLDDVFLSLTGNAARLAIERARGRRTTVPAPTEQQPTPQARRRPRSASRGRPRAPLATPRASPSATSCASCATRGCW